MREMGFMEKLLDGAHVEWKSLASICKIETGKLNANAATEDGAYMFFTTAKEVSKIDKYRWDTEALLIAGNANVGDVKHYSGKFEAYQRTYVLTNFSEKLNVRYLFHIVSNSLKQYLEDRTNSAAMTYIVLSTLENFPIPIPCPDNPKKSLEIQAEIVRILDAMTAHTAELTAELTARKKQYDYYRDKLLSFEEGEVEWRTLVDVIKTIKTGKLNANAMVDNGNYPFFTCDSKPFRIDTYAFDTEAIIVSGNGSQVGHINYYKGKFNAYQRTYILADCIEEIKIKFLLIYLKAYLRPYIMQHSKKGSVPYITLPMLQSFKVPLPSLEKQIQIISVLEKFEVFTESLFEGLPREIELRQKQYAYYRDLLLSFPQAQAA